MDCSLSGQAQLLFCCWWERLFLYRSFYIAVLIQNTCKTAAERKQHFFFKFKTQIHLSILCMKESCGSLFFTIVTNIWLKQHSEQEKMQSGTWFYQWGFNWMVVLSFSCDVWWMTGCHAHESEGTLFSSKIARAHELKIKWCARINNEYCNIT